LRALAGLQPAQGEIRLMDRPLMKWPALERACRLSWMGQAQAVPLDLTVQDVVELGRWPHTQVGQDEAGNAGGQDKAVSDAIRAMGLQDLCGRGLHQVSGGECQRALLARAMAAQTQVMLFDEPLNHLDMPHQNNWLRWLRARVCSGAAALTVMHELNQALGADQLLVMRSGRVLHQGPPGQLETREALQEAFGQTLSFHAIDTQGTTPRWVVLPHPIS
jgi:iron complex transport system ATP-binding protein